jgi:hypothetical protein
MAYYDNECPAHAELKRTVRALGCVPDGEPPLVFYHEGEPIVDRR